MDKRFDEFIDVKKPFGKIFICGLEGYGKTLLLSAIAVKCMLNGLNDCFKSHEIVDRYNTYGYNFSKNYEHLVFCAFIGINCSGTHIPDRISYDFDPFHFALYCEDYETDIYPPYSHLFVPEAQRVWPSYKAEQIRAEVLGKMETGRQAKFDLVFDAQRLMMVAKPIRDLCNRIIFLEEKVEEIKDVKGVCIGHRLHIVEFKSNREAENFVNNPNSKFGEHYTLRIDKCMYDNFMSSYFEYMSLIGREEQDFRIVEHKEIETIEDIENMTSILMPEGFLVSKNRKAKKEEIEIPVDDELDFEF